MIVFAALLRQKSSIVPRFTHSILSEGIQPESKILNMLQEELCYIQRTITYMHFDNYLQNKNIQPPHSNYNKFAYPTTQNPNHNSSFRQTATQHNLNFSKAPSSYAESRPESSRQAIQSNFNASLLKKGNLQPKQINPGLPFSKPQVTATNNYITLAANGQKTTEQKKYICLSPAKYTSKVSNPPEQPPTHQQKIQQRRSQSVTDPRLKEFSQNSYLPWSRESTVGLGMAKQTSHTTPFQINFNNTQLFPEKTNSHIERKESTEKAHFFKTIQNQWSNPPNRENNRITPFQQLKNQKPYYFAEKRQSQAVVSNPISFNDSVYKQSSSTIANTEIASNKDSSRQDYLKQYSTSKNLVFIEKDIQKLKNASKRVDEVYQSEINKNYYFNKFLEEKGIKVPEQEKNEVKQTKSAKDLQKRIESLEKQLQEKQKEIVDKTQDISERTKNLLDKNKVIDSLSIELKQTKNRLEGRQLELKDKQKQLLEKKENLQSFLAQKQSQELFYQQIIEQNKKKQEKDSHYLELMQTENQRLRQEIEKKVQQCEKLNAQSRKLSQKLHLQEQKGKRYHSQIQNLKEKIRLIQNQLTKALQKLQQQHLKVKEKEILIQQLRKEKENFKIIENISYQNLPSQQWLEKQQEFNRNKQQIEKLTQKITDNEAKLNQLAILLLNKDNYDHDSVILKLKQLKQSMINTQVLRQKEQERMQEIHIQRLHQEYIEKKFNQLSREFKKINSKFCMVTNEAQQGWRLLREANNQIVLLNLQNVNQKYKKSNQQAQ